MSDKSKGEYCEICGKFVEGFVYQGCCDGKNCTCRGMPIEPCVCSKNCYEKLLKGKRRKKNNDKNK